MDAPVRRSKFLVFTSAGDANNISQWLPDREFDLWVYYYGDQEAPPVTSQADFCLHSKAGKMQNFHKCWLEFKDVIAGYDSILLADDDIEISGRDINKLFAYRVKLDVKALQPGMDPAGKNSHKFNEVKIFSEYRRVNFVEIGFIVFETEALLDFMQIYSPEVNCWGVDWWFCSHFKKYGDGRLAIIDTISCVNPYDDKKPLGSEIFRAFPGKVLAEDWNRFQKMNNIVTDKGCYIVYKRAITFSPSALIKQFYLYASYSFNRVLRKLKVAR